MISDEIYASHVLPIMRLRKAIQGILSTCLTPLAVIFYRFDRTGHDFT
jgi:hypothetical protein